MKKIICLLLVLCSLLICNQAKALNDIDIDVNSNNAILYDVTDDMVMMEKNSQEKIKIASMTKVMTALVAIENIKDLDEKTVITENDYKNVYSENLAIVGFTIGEEVTYRDLLYGLLLKSGADAGYALADKIAGSEEKFVELMNKKAKELGLKGTKFTNVVGYDEDNYSTVSDVVIFFKEALNNKTFKEMISTDTYTTTNTKFTLNNVIDELVLKSGNDSIYSQYILGGKTGYTKGAKFCLASYAQYNGTTYIVVTANGNTNDHINDALKMYEKVFTNYSRQQIIGANDYLTSISSIKDNKIKIYADQEIDVLLPNDAKKEDVVLKYDGIKSIDKQIKQNELLGQINLTYNGETIKSVDIFYHKKIENKMNIKRIVQHQKKIPILLFVVLTVVGLFILFSSSLFVSMYRDVKNHKRRWKF